MYQENYSAIRKITSDCAQLILIFVLLLSSSLMVFKGDVAGEPPQSVRLFLSGVCFLGAILFLYGFAYKIVRIKTFRRDWRIEINNQFIRLETPDAEELESFEYACEKIKKLSREAYEDDGICYKWFIYIEENGGEVKKEFDLGPFSEENIVEKMKQIFGIDAVEVDINGAPRKWKYSLWFKLKTLFSSALGTIIFLSFVIPSFFYLVKVIKGLGN